MKILDREDNFIGIMKKIDDGLTKISLETKSSDNSSPHSFTSSRILSLLCPTRVIKVKLPKLELKLFDENILN